MPKALRWILQDRAALTDFRYQFRRKLKRDGHSAGLMRWHWFGDCDVCKAKGCDQCNQTGSGSEWHPHLNILLQGGYRTDLASWILDIERWQRNYCLKVIRSEIKKKDLLIEKYGIHLDNLDTVYTELDQLKKLYNQTQQQAFIIHYSYTSNKKQIANKLKYVLRSTFRRYNYDTQKLLYNYRNSTRYGFKPVKLSREALCCDLCKNVIKWHKLETYKNHTYEHTGKGIFRMAERSEGGNRLFLRLAAKNRTYDPTLLSRRNC